MASISLFDFGFENLDWLCFTRSLSNPLSAEVRQSVKSLPMIEANHTPINGAARGISNGLLGLLIVAVVAEERLSWSWSKEAYLRVSNQIGCRIPDHSLFSLLWIWLYYSYNTTM